MIFSKLYKYDELPDRNRELREQISRRKKNGKYEKTFEMVYARIEKQIESKKSEFNKYRKKYRTKKVTVKQ